MIFWLLLAIPIWLTVLTVRSFRKNDGAEALIGVIAFLLYSAVIGAAAAAADAVRAVTLLAAVPDPYWSQFRPLYDCLWPLEKMWLTLRDWRWDGPVGEGELFVLMAAFGAVMMGIGSLLAWRSK